MVKTTISIPDKDFDKLKKYCKDHEMKFSGLVRLSLRGVIQNG